jgi:hypothetical protein
MFKFIIIFFQGKIIIRGKKDWILRNIKFFKMKFSKWLLLLLLLFMGIIIIIIF